MNPHLFLFQPGLWLGEGQISFASSKETVRFFTRWQLIDQTPEALFWLQEVELHALDQTTRNFFTLTDIKGKNFNIVLENELMGKVSGKGVIGPENIAWELRTHPHQEGYEIYKLQNDGTYLFNAEYVSLDPYRTLIEGKIWQKS